MKFDELDISVKDFLGRMGPGIVAVLSVIYNQEVYEALYWYTEEIHMIQLPGELKNQIGEIEKHKKYEDIMEHLKKSTPDYKENAPNFTDIFENPNSL
jgi:predicted transcriptional regulator